MTISVLEACKTTIYTRSVPCHAGVPGDATHSLSILPLFVCVLRQKASPANVSDVIAAHTTWHGQSSPQRKVLESAVPLVLDPSNRSADRAAGEKPAPHLMESWNMILPGRYARLAIVRSRSLLNTQVQALLASGML